MDFEILSADLRRQFIEVHIKVTLFPWPPGWSKGGTDVAELLRSEARRAVIGMDSDNRADLEKRITAIRDLGSKDGSCGDRSKGEDIGVYLRRAGMRPWP